MENREQNGMAYILVNVNELGNNVPSLVPYDYSSEEEKEKTSDHSNQFSQHHVKSNVESQSESPKSDSSGMSEDYASCLPADSIFYTSDNESNLDKKDKYREDDSDEDYVPRSPEGYHILTTNETFDVSFCHGILKDNGCNESSYLFHAVNVPGCFVANLHKEEHERLKGDSRVRKTFRMNTFCED